MARRRRRLARTGWATVLDPAATSPRERSVPGAFGPDGQSPVAAARRAAAAHTAVRTLVDRPAEAGPATPERVRDTRRRAGIRSPGRAGALVVATAAAPAVPADGATVAGAYWFALPLLAALCRLAITRAGDPRALPVGLPRRAATAPRRGPGTGRGGPLTAAAVRGLRAVRAPGLRAAAAGRPARP